MEIDREFLDELSEQIEQGELYYLQQQVHNVDLEALKEKLASQVDSAEDIFAEMTREGYYAQEVEISPNLSATFRTIPSKAQDDAMDYAVDRAEGNKAKYGRILARRRLAYALVSYNGRTIGDQLDRSLYDIQLEGNDPMEIIEGLADKSYEILKIIPDHLGTRLSQAFGVWEKIVDEIIKEADHVELAKK